MKKQTRSNIWEEAPCDTIPLSPAECFREYLRTIAARMNYLADALTDEPAIMHRLSEGDKILMRQSVIPTIDEAQVMIKTGLMAGNIRMLEDGESVMTRTKELLATID